MKPARELFRTTPIPGSPDWSTAPPWARYKALDRAGWWYWYESEPVPGYDIWVRPIVAGNAGRPVPPGNRMMVAGGGPRLPGEGWTFTLEERPRPRLVDYPTNEDIYGDMGDPMPPYRNFMIWGAAMVWVSITGLLVAAALYFTGVN